MPEPENRELDLMWMVEAAARFQSRYPNLIRKVHSNQDALEIVFFIEDLAMACAHELQKAGVACIHRLSAPRRVRLRTDMICADKDEHHAIAVLENYLNNLQDKQCNREGR
jgi:hypothetical protein